MAPALAIDTRDCGGPGQLLVRSLAQLVGVDAAATIPFAPLVIVAGDRTPASAWLAAYLDAAPAPTAIDRIAIWDGAALGRAGAEHGVDRLHDDLSRHRLVVVDHIDRVGDPERQRAVASLLDALHASGTATCVSLATHPALARTLEPPLASRLTGGLLVVFPDSPPATVAPDARSVRRPLSLGRVFACVARHQDCSVADLIGPSRCRAIAAVRSLAMYVARMVTQRSFHAIGAACGGRDHTTVMHAVRVVARRMARDAAFAAEVGLLVQRLAAAAPHPLAGSLTVDSVSAREPIACRRPRRRGSHRRQATSRLRAGGG